MNEIIEAIWRERNKLRAKSPRRVELTHRLRMGPILFDKLRRELNPFTDFAFRVDLHSEQWTLFGIQIVEDDTLVASWKWEPL